MDIARRIISSDPVDRAALIDLMDRLLPVVTSRLAAASLESPRVIIVGCARSDHANDGELTVRSGRRAWIWLPPSPESSERRTWTAAHELGHLLLQAGAGWRLMADSTAGERLVGEYLAERLAREIVDEAGLARAPLVYDTAYIEGAPDLWLFACRKAGKILDGRGVPADPARVREAVRLVARAYAYALPQALAGEPAAVKLTSWLADRPVLGARVAPLTDAAVRLATTASLAELATVQRTIGAATEALLVAHFSGDALERALAPTSGD